MFLLFRLKNHNFGQLLSLKIPSSASDATLSLNTCNARNFRDSHPIAVENKQRSNDAMGFTRIKVYTSSTRGVTGLIKYKTTKLYKVRRINPHTTVTFRENCPDEIDAGKCRIKTAVQTTRRDRVTRRRRARL